MQENYKILGLTETATDEEIESSYKALKAKYSKDRFLEGDEGNNAAKNLTRLENAYTEIMEERNSLSKNNSNNDKNYSSVTEFIKAGRLDDAQNLLDNDFDRDAEWHYFQAVIFYKKNWTNESKKQLEIAMNMDPFNQKYKKAYQSLNTKAQAAQAHFHSGNTNYNNDGQNNNRQMGGDTCGNMADCCAMWCCMDTMCNCCCR
jgi:DnaJ-class molecular chaperone